MKPALILTLALAAAPAAALDAQRGPLTVTPVATNLDAPWAVAALPDGTFLVTEREGALQRIVNGTASAVRGVPRVAAVGQGGLLDITLARDFATTRTLFLTYSKPQGRGAGTALAAAELSVDGTRLVNLRDLFVSAPGSSGAVISAAGWSRRAIARCLSPSEIGGTAPRPKIAACTTDRSCA
jgi:glucose/arabinose dehydrogenase